MAADYENVDIDAVQVIDTRVIFVNIHNVFVDLGASEYDFVTSHFFTLTQDFVNGSYRFEFSGDNFKHLGDIPIGGTITKMTVFFNGVQEYQFTDIHISVADAYDLFQTKSIALLKSMMHGKNTVGGSAFGDYIETFKGNDKLFGNAGDDFLFGGSGRDKLWGGTGTNSLTGGGAADKFYFDSPPSPGNHSSILDFKPDDRIVLDSAIFFGLPIAGNHLSNTALSLVDDSATNKSPHIYYNQAQGDLWYIDATVTYYWADLQDGAALKAKQLLIE